MEWSNHIDVDPSVLENHWYLTMSSVVFLGEKFDIPTGHMDRLIELDTGEDMGIGIISQLVNLLALKDRRIVSFIRPSSLHFHEVPGCSTRQMKTYIISQKTTKWTLHPFKLPSPLPVCHLYWMFHLVLVEDQN